MMQFGSAYSLQEKFDGDFYAIIDTSNNPKKMFHEQKIVDFKKTWFFHDHIKKLTKEPDLEYLSNFEKKYQIDLWKLAINERHFYKFNKFYKFKKNEILLFLEQECKLFEKILDETKPDYFLTYDPPFHHHKLILDLCKAKGVKVLCLCLSKFEDKCIITDDGARFNFPQDLDSIELTNSEEYQFEDRDKKSEYNKLTNKWTNERGSSTLDKFKALKDYILYSDSKNTESNFTYYGRDKLSVISDTVLFFLRKFLRTKYLQQNSVHRIDLDTPYAYFPLGIDADSALLHYAPFFTNQIDVIKNVAKSLPIDYRLYVKDHIHAVFRGWKEIGQYKEIKEIPNVVLIHPSVSSKELIKNSNIVITVRGSTAVEASIEEKPVVIFGEMPHDMLPSVFNVKRLEELPKTIRTALNTPINSKDIKKYLKLIKEKSISFNWFDYEIRRNNQFFSGNILSDIEYPEKKVKEFFDNNKDVYDTLAEAYLAKID